MGGGAEGTVLDSRLGLDSLPPLFCFQLYHRCNRITTVRNEIRGWYTSPCVEELVRGHYGLKECGLVYIRRRALKAGACQIIQAIFYNQ